MILDLHPGIRIRTVTIGSEKSPLVVIDNFVADPEALVRYAAASTFRPIGAYYPGVRTEAPLEYAQLIVTRLGGMLRETFALPGEKLRFQLCHYSLITTPASQLKLLQRIPHFDSVEPDGLATVHYLFHRNLGGTAFYRHRKTGFESITEARRDIYYRSLESENDGPNMPPPGYINGDTALFEEIAREDGVFNRMLIYRRNCLHSGCIDKDFVPDPNPLTGRLSINTFIDFLAS
ncbi:MAG TPA: DUF6445 family protein [Steroidobacteraceae bacterium]